MRVGQWRAAHTFRHGLYDVVVAVIQRDVVVVRDGRHLDEQRAWRAVGAKQHDVTAFERVNGDQLDFGPVNGRSDARPASVMLDLSSGGAFEGEFDIEHTSSLG